MGQVMDQPGYLSFVRGRFYEKGPLDESLVKALEDLCKAIKDDTQEDGVKSCGWKKLTSN